MKKLMIAAFLLMGAICANAQSYDWGIGLRGGYASSGFTAKCTFSSNAIEANIGISEKGSLRVSALYEFTIPVIDDGFTFYYGAGPHIGTFRRDSASADDKDFSQGIMIGVVGVAGLEYEIPTIPFSVFIDYRPRINIGNGLGITPNDFGLGIRYCF